MVKAQFIFQAECSSAFSLEVWGRKKMSIFTTIARMNAGRPLTMMKQQLLGDTEDRLK